MIALKLILGAWWGWLLATMFVYGKRKTGLTGGTIFRVGLLFVLCLSACSQVTGEITLPVNAPVLDPIFVAFYNALGGEEVLGQVIAEPSSDGSRRLQFTENALLVYDPNAQAGQNWRLEALGTMLVGGALAGEAPGVAEIFRERYDRLGGQTMVGMPLTGLRYQPELQRYEQYFENLAFYVAEGDGAEQARSLALGAWKCDYKCRSQAPGSSLVTIYPETAEPFRGWVNAVGAGLTGLPLSPLVTSADGQAEQVFENVVLVHDNASGEVRLRELPERAGLIVQHPTAPAADPYTVFYLVENGLGYNIPQEVLVFIKNHGGFKIIGEPISEMEPAERGGFQQCFKYLCLEWDPLLETGSQVKPAALGYAYRRLSPPLRSEKVFGGFNEPHTIIKVWEVSPAISPSQSQEINALVLQNGYPAAGAALALTVELPDRDALVFNLRPTGSDGQTHQILPPIAAANAILIPYRVCPVDPSQASMCVEDSFMIWSER